jgi:hypothetical protein
MKAHSTPGLTLVHRMAIIPFQSSFGLGWSLSSKVGKKNPDKTVSG